MSIKLVGIKTAQGPLQNHMVINNHTHAQMVNKQGGRAPCVANQTVDILARSMAKGRVVRTVAKYLFLRLVSPTLSSLTLSKRR